MDSYCCERMEYYAERNKEIYHNSCSRCFAMKLEPDTGYSYQELWYCPWCGVKLPKDLGRIWMEVLKEEYGLKDPIFDDKDKVPPEFHTDEWWKKRGL